MTVSILVGDCRDLLKTLPDESVHCVVTSPPYFGLRDYGTGRWEGGDPACDHRSPTMRKGRNEDPAKLAGSAATNSAQNVLAHGAACGLCGARKVDSQIGLEPSPEEFVEAMVTVFRDVRRVLRSGGTLWLNLGDTYASAWPCSRRNVVGSGSLANGKREARPPRMGDGIKEKDLFGIPWAVAFALRADGWYLRQDIIWSKPNPMPESVTDRCTKAHEYLFLLSKSERYHYDADAIAEPLGEASIDRLSQSGLAGQAGSDRVPGKTNGAMKAVGRRAPGNHSHKGATAYAEDDGEFHRTKAGLVDFAERERAKVASGDLIGTRNKRSVWTVTTQPFSEAHFATFPPALIEPCIKAGCPAGGTVLDPFGGAGTTGLVADRLQRNAILLELNPDYAAMAERRIKAEGGMLCDVRLQNLDEKPSSTSNGEISLSQTPGGHVTA